MGVRDTSETNDRGSRRTRGAGGHRVYEQRCTTAPRALRWLSLTASHTHGGSGRDDARRVRAGRSGVRKSGEAGCRRRGVVKRQRAIEGGKSARGRHVAARRAATGGGGGGAGRGRRRGPGSPGGRGAGQPVRRRGESTTARQANPPAVRSLDLALQTVHTRVANKLRRAYSS